jgi:hypothetical protein
MSKKIFGFALGALLFALCSPADAQQPKKASRIGFLIGASASSNVARLDAFRQGLRELGYVEGKALSLSIDMQRENPIVSPRSRPN